MAHSRLPLALGIIGSLMSCSPTPIDEQREQSALMQVSREWAQAAASGDLERIVSYWADDAIVLPPDQPAVVGKAAIRDYVRAGQAVPGFSVTWEPEQATIARGGDLGYLIEHNRFTFGDAKGGVRTQFGKAITVWRKDANGSWKCVIDTWNNNPQEKALSRAGRGLQLPRSPKAVEPAAVSLVATSRVGGRRGSLPGR